MRTTIHFYICLTALFLSPAVIKAQDSWTTQYPHGKCLTDGCGRALVPTPLYPNEVDTMPNEKFIQPWEFRWTPVEGATEYHLIVKQKDSTPTVDEEGITETSLTRWRHVPDPCKILDWVWVVRAKVDCHWQPWSQPQSFNVAPRIYRSVSLKRIRCIRRNESGYDDVFVRIVDGNGNVHQTGLYYFGNNGQVQELALAAFPFGKSGKVFVEVWEDDDFLRGGDDLLLKLEIGPRCDIAPRAIGGDGSYSVVLDYHLAAEW